MLTIQSLRDKYLTKKSDTKKSLKLTNLINSRFKDYLFDWDTKYQIILGGRASTKSTVNTLKIALLLIQESNHEVIVLRENYSDIKNTVFKDLINAFSMLGVDLIETTHYPRGNNLWIKYNGNIIHFHSSNSYSKLKGFRPLPQNAISIIYLFEADQFTVGEFGINQIYSTLSRGMKHKTKNGNDLFVLIGEWNPPPISSHWIFVWKRRLELRDDTNIINFCYNDLTEYQQQNWLGSSLMKEIEIMEQLDPEMYKHIYLGHLARLKGLVFNSYDPEHNLKDLESTKKGLTMCGLDYSSGNDGTVMYHLELTPRSENLNVLKEYYYHPEHSISEKKMKNFIKDAGDFIEQVYEDNGNRPFTFFVDSASNTRDFYHALNAELLVRRVHYCEVRLVSKKPSNEIDIRISTLNLMLSSGFIQIDKSCEYLIKCFDSVKFNEKTGKYIDDTKTMYTDCLDGLVYAFLDRLVDFREMILSGYVADSIKQQIEREREK